MKLMKRFWAAVLTCALLLPTMATNVNAEDTTTSDDGAYLLYEDFSGEKKDLVNAGWDKGADVTLVNNQLQLGTTDTSMYLVNEEAATWSNYTYEAEVTITETTEDAPSVDIACILAGVNGDKKGYEFSLFYTHSSQKYGWNLRDRINNKAWYNFKETYDFEVGETVTLKMVLNGTSIQCYINDELVADVDAATKSEVTIANNTITGTIGLRANGCVAKFDNLRVYSTPGTWFKDNFNGDAASIEAKGWSTNWSEIFNLTTDGKLESYAWGYMLLDGNTAVANWKNYTFEADVRFTTTEVEGNGSGGRMAGIVIGTGSDASKNNLEWCIYASGTKGSDLEGTEAINLRLYERKDGEKSQVKVKEDKTDRVTFGTEVNLKIEVSETEIACYLDDQYIGTYTVEGGISATTIGLHAVGNVCTFDNVSVRPTTQADNNYFNVAFYRGDRETVIHPMKEGSVFAGWYKDAAFTTPLGVNETIGKAYAKFVDEKVLSVKAQISSDTTIDSATTNMRFVTTVDCFDYENVGFVINGKKYGETTTVYETITAGEGGIAVSYTPAAQFSEKSIRFATVTLHSIPLYKDANGNGVKDDGETDNTNTALTVTAYWTTADGTVVEGVTRTDITIQKGIDAINDQSTSQPYSLR